MIHETAIVSPKARLGANVSVGPFTIVHDDVEIGDNTTIEGYCEIGKPAHSEEDRGPLVVGRDSVIRSHSTLYGGSTFGDKLLTGHRVLIRERTTVGKNLQIGSLGDIEGHCHIGDYVRFHSNVHICQKSQVGNFVWIFPYVVLTNDPHPPSDVMIGVTIEDYVAVATMSVVLPGITIGTGSLVGAHSSVTKDVDPHSVVVGNPAKYRCGTERIRLRDGSGKQAYPWRRHFVRGYPVEVVEDWKAEFPMG